MGMLRRVVLWAALVLIILLVLFSICGAFLGAEAAKRFFNSIPLGFYWAVLLLVLAAGLLLFRRLIRIPGLLLMHLGCILILVGGIWGSPAGHAFCKLLGSERIIRGQMPILEGTQENEVWLEGGKQTKELPFFIRLKKFRMEYYDGGRLLVQTRQGQRWSLRAQPGSEQQLGDDVGKVKVTQVFRNFKIDIKADKRTAYDAGGEAENPALEVQVERPDGRTTTRYVFEHFGGHTQQGDPLVMQYVRAIRDYISELEVVKDDKVVASKSIEVNHPLHYSGYHFYQHSYNVDRGRYSILLVVSDAGLSAVYAGYVMLCGGVIWHLWVRHALSFLTRRRNRMSADRGV